MAEFMGKIDIWLSCSHTEGLGRMSLEAMSASAACVLTNTGAEFAVDKENCLLTEVGNIRQITTAVDSLLVDPKLRQKLSVGAYETAVKWADESDYKANLNKLVLEIFNG